MTSRGGRKCGRERELHGGAGLPCTGGLTALGLPCSAGESEADGHPGTRWRAAGGSRRQQPGRVSDRLIARARAVAAVAPPPHPASPASAGSRSVPSPASCHSCPLFPPTPLSGSSPPPPLPQQPLSSVFRHPASLPPHPAISPVVFPYPAGSSLWRTSSHTVHFNFTAGASLHVCLSPCPNVPLLIRAFHSRCPRSYNCNSSPCHILTRSCSSSGQVISLTCPPLSV